MSLAARERRQGWGLIAPALLWLLAFFLIPFAVMLALSFAHMEERTVVHGFDPGNYIRIFTDWTMFKALVNSVEITLIVTVVSVVLAYPLAAIIAFRVPRRWQRLALLLAVLPFWTSYVVRSYAWLLVLGQNGVLNKALLGLGLISAPLEIAATRTATVIGFVHFFVMLLTLTIYANLIQLSPNYARAAQDLGELLTDEQGVRGDLVEAVLDASDHGLHDLLEIGVEELLRMSRQQTVEEVERVDLHVRS